jgi:hypothetical protein
MRVAAPIVYKCLKVEKSEKFRALIGQAGTNEHELRSSVHPRMDEHRAENTQG